MDEGRLVEVEPDPEILEDNIWSATDGLWRGVDFEEMEIMLDEEDSKEEEEGDICWLKDDDGAA